MHKYLINISWNRGCRITIKVVHPIVIILIQISELSEGILNNSLLKNGGVDLQFKKGGPWIESIQNLNFRLDYPTKAQLWVLMKKRSWFYFCISWQNCQQSWQKFAKNHGIKKLKFCLLKEFLYLMWILVNKHYFDQIKKILFYIFR